MFSDGALYTAINISKTVLKVTLLMFVFKVIPRILPNSPVNVHVLQLRINGVTQADAGTYSCEAKNRHGSTTKSIKVTVTP